MSFNIPNTPASPTTGQEIQASPDSGDFAAIAAAIGGVGVVSGCAVTAQGSPDMTLAVASGETTDDNFATTDTVTSGNVTIGAAEASPRLDLVVSREGTKTVLSGTADDNPAFPTFLSTDVLLAAVYVGSGVTAITSADIIDKRLVIPAVATGSTNLGYTASPTDGTVTSDTGTDAPLTLADTTNAGLLNPDDFKKLVSVTTTYVATGGDDTAYLQAALDGTSAVRISGTVLVSSQIKLNPGQVLWADSFSSGIIKQADGSNLSVPLIAAKGWSAHTGVSNPVWIFNLGVDGNKANNTGSSDGILLFNWESVIQGCHVYNCTGSGIVLTDVDDAVTVPAGTLVENRILRNRVSTCDGRGIYVWEQSGTGKLTDGFCTDNIINACALDGILIDRGAGWLIDGNHTYTGTGLGTMGIRVKSAFSTRVTNNYVDNYGQSATTGFYSGIRVEISTTRGSVISGNTISCTEDTAGSTYRHLYVLAGSGITTARATVFGNVIAGASASNGTGIRIEAGSGTTFSCHVFGNKVDACNTSFTGVATGTLTGRFDLYGSATPEGAVTAPIGATFTRSDGGTATTLYVKESGTGNTGWAAVGSGGVTSVDGNTGAVTASQLLTAIKTVDGPGSGLDADLLDGSSSAAFAAASHAHAASDVTVADTGGYYTGTDVEAALQEVGLDLSGLGDVTALQRLFAGMTYPIGSLERWKAGPGLEATTLTAAITDTATTIAFFDASFRADTVDRLAYIDDEEIWITAEVAGRTVTDGVLNTTTTVTSATASFAAATDTGRRITGTGIPHGAYISSVTNSTTVVLSTAATATATGVTLTLLEAFTVERGVNGTTAAAHSAGAAVKATKVRGVLHLGDSIAEGTTGDTSEAGDGWSIRAARVLGKRMGGEIAQMWPIWRRTGLAQVHQEWTLTGSNLTAGYAWDVGWGGAILYTAGTGNGGVWTRPAYLNVSVIDFHWIDVSANSCQWSYSVDGGSTWIDNPVSTSLYSSGPGLLRRTRVLVDNPTTVRFRAATAAGTSKTIVFSAVPLTTWSTPPAAGVTEGVLWANLGSAGSKLRTFLNSRTYTDLQVTNGDATVTSATMTFVTADVDSTIMLEGVEYTVLSRTSGTEIELTANYAGTTSSADARGTIFQSDTVGDRMGTFLGHSGSSYPDLVIMGPWDNDEPSGSDGDGNPDAMYDMLTYFHTRVSPVADILYIGPHESDDVATSISTQAAYRTAIELVASENDAAVLNMYDAFAGYGYAGFDALDAAGLMADVVHFSQSGERFMGAHLARILEVI